MFLLFVKIIFNYNFNKYEVKINLRSILVRLKLVFYSLKRIQIPLHYNYLLQGIIYNNLSSKLSSWLHNNGWYYGKRRYSLFTFSKLFGQNVKIFQQKIKKISFKGEIWFKVSSVSEDFLQDIAESIIKRGGIHIGSYFLELKSIEMEHLFKRKDKKSSLLVRSISPMVAYSTVKINGRAKTHYFAPKEDDFVRSLKNSLERKAKAFYKDEKLPEISINGFKLKKVFKNIKLYYMHPKQPKPWFILGWDCLWELSLPSEYLFLAMATGLGSRTSQGFGMVEEVD